MIISTSSAVAVSWRTPYKTHLSISAQHPINMYFNPSEGALIHTLFLEVDAIGVGGSIEVLLNLLGWEGGKLFQSDDHHAVLEIFLLKSGYNVQADLS